jgi:hypothetical protein
MEGTPTNGEVMAQHLKREFDVLAEATKGLGMASVISSLAIQAVLADTGQLCAGNGEPGYAWQPDVYQRKAPHDPVGERIRVAGATFGRVMAGGHPTHRSYLAYLEAMYRVTTAQEDEVARRIEELWDALETKPELVLVPTPTEREHGVIVRLWKRFIAWWRASYEPEPQPEPEEKDNGTST